MGAFLLGARSLLGKIPWQVWAIVIGLLLLWRAHAWHEREVRQADVAGYTRAMNHMADKARTLADKADKLADEIRRKSDEEARTIADRADNLSLRGPGAARCPTTPSSAAPGRHQPGGGQADDPGAGVPPEDRAAVPWTWLVRQGEVCDLNRNEVLSWREWFSKLNDKL